MRKILIVSVLALAALSTASVAQARDYWSVSINTPIIVAAERPVRYVEYHEPAPRVIYRSEPVYATSVRYYNYDDRNCRGRSEHRHHHKHHDHGRHYGR